MRTGRRERERERPQGRGDAGRHGARVLSVGPFKAREVKNASSPSGLPRARARADTDLIHMRTRIRGCNTWRRIKDEHMQRALRGHRANYNYRLIYTLLVVTTKMHGSLSTLTVAPEFMNEWEKSLTNYS
mgnify:CR=1 FL=1